MKGSDFIAALVMHFPVRHESEAREMEWTRSIIDVIVHYEGSVLDAAAKRIINTRTDRRFPLPAEIGKVCAQVTMDNNRTKLSFEPRLGKSEPYSAHRIRLADELIDGPMGRDAARNGWILSLHDFIRREGRLPADHERRSVIQGASDFDDGYEIAARGGWSGSAKLAALGEKMLARREEFRGRLIRGA